MEIVIISAAVLVASVGCLIEERFRDCSGKWVCSEENGFKHVQFTCADADLEEIYINLMTLVADWSQLVGLPVKSLAVNKCKKLRLNVNYRTPFKFKRLQVNQVGELIILGSNEADYGLQQPADLAFTNIGHINSIDAGTFHLKEAEDIIFRDVTIDTIKKGAFSNFKAMSSFILDTVSIRAIQNRAIDVKLHAEGMFQMSKCYIDIAEEGSFQVDFGSIIITSTTFNNAQLSALSGYARSFEFTSNQMMQSAERMNLIAEDIVITDNLWKKMDHRFPINWQKYLAKKTFLDTNLTLIFLRNEFANGWATKEVDHHCTIEEYGLEPDVSCTVILSDSGCDSSYYNLFQVKCDEKCLKGVCARSTYLHSPSFATLMTFLCGIATII